MKKLLLLSLIFAFPVFAATSSAIVAEVGDIKITNKEFNHKYDAVKKSLNPPTKEQFLEDLVRFQIGVQEAKKRKMDQDPVVQERLEQIMYVHLVETELGQKATDLNVKESEMREFYKSNPELRTSHILIELKPNATAKEHAVAKKRAQEIYSEVKKSKRPFEELVKLYSDDSLSKVNGGDIGWHTPLTLPNRDYYNTAMKMKVGNISGLVETAFGFHIIKLTGINKFEDADKTKIRAAVLETKKKALFDKFFASLKSKYKIKTYKENLE